jgi:hypothetical protein
MTNPPTPKPVRLTITVSAEVHSTFKRLAVASGMPIGRAMGEWLADTLEAVEFMATKVEEARAAPRRVIQELHAYALGAADETQQLLQDIRSGKIKPSPLQAAALGAADTSAQRRPPPAAPPRPVIRGGKSRSGNTDARSHPRGENHGE